MTAKYNLYEELENDIKSAYQNNLDPETAECLAAKFLLAQIEVGKDYQAADLGVRMKKTGLKAVRAAVYLEEATRTDKKPSDTYLEALVNRNELVIHEQQAFDEADNERALLENYLHIFREAHIFFRSVAKGRFE